MSNLINTDYEKILTFEGIDVFKMIKTKTNKYYLIEIETGKIVANTKKGILQKIKEWGDRTI